MELEIGSPRFENVRRNAKWTHAHLDTRLEWDVDNVKDAVSHLEDCKNTPTIGLLARHEATAKGIAYPSFYERNLNCMLRNYKIKQLNDEFNSQLKELYSKTLNTRMFLIETESVVLRCVKKHSSIFKKFMYKFFHKG